MNIESFLAGVLFVMILLLFLKISTLQEDNNSMKAKIKDMKYTLDQFAEHMQLPEAPIDDDLRALIEEGKDIEAVKVARENLGLSLLEGKQYTDALKSGHM